MNLSEHLARTGQARRLLSEIAGREPSRQRGDETRWHWNGSEHNLILYSSGIVFDPKTHPDEGEDLCGFAMRVWGIDFRELSERLEAAGYDMPDRKAKLSISPVSRVDAAIQRLGASSGRARGAEHSAPQPVEPAPPAGPPAVTAVPAAAAPPAMPLEASESPAGALAASGAPWVPFPASEPLEAVPAPAEGFPKPASGQRGIARAIATAAEPWPARFDGSHPGWRWCAGEGGAKTGAWDPSWPCPPWLRWIDRALLEQVASGTRHHGAGAIVLPLFGLQDWSENPLPPPESCASVLCVYLAADGAKPAGNEPDKRTFGGKADVEAMACFGWLRQADRCALVEGIADALTLYRTLPGKPCVIFSGGLDLYKRASLLSIASSMACDCWIDNDDGNKARDAARKFMRAARGKPQVRCIPHGSDPYDAFHAKPNGTQWLFPMTSASHPNSRPGSAVSNEPGAPGAPGKPEKPEEPRFAPAVLEAVRSRAARIAAERRAAARRAAIAAATQRERSRRVKLREPDWKAASRWPLPAKPEQLAWLLARAERAESARRVFLRNGQLPRSERLWLDEQARLARNAGKTQVPRLLSKAECAKRGLPCLVPGPGDKWLRHGKPVY